MAQLKDTTITGNLTVSGEIDLNKILESSKFFASPSGSSGTPTFRSLTTTDLPVADYVVAKGTSGIWSYWKWNSGLAILIGEKQSTNNWTGNTWGSIYDGCDMSMGNYPFTFSQLPCVTAYVQSCDNNASGYFMISIATNGTMSSSPGMSLVRAAQGTYGHPVLKCLVVGRWK